MKLMVCLDERGGMMFHHRRQSRDRTVIGDMLQLCGTKPLWMDAYSAGMFSHDPARVVTDENFLLRTPWGSYGFAEKGPLMPYEYRIEQIVIYLWNRVYPGDVFFDMDMENWILTEEKEWKGSSHDKITRRIYSRS